MEILTTSPRQTKRIGEILAAEIWRSFPKKEAFIVGLKGGLGGGKTTFVQGFARGLGIREKILSPTFVVMKKWIMPVSAKKNTTSIKPSTFYFFHIDCYRLQKPQEILALGFKKIISEKRNIVVVEWAEKIREVLPKRTLWINFNFIDKKTRRISLAFSKPR